MMEKAQQQIVRDLSNFDEEISLYQMIPSGKGKSVALLKAIVDSVLNNNNKSKIPSVLITGKEGKRTHARAFSRALGIDKITEIDGSLLQVTIGLPFFFDASPNETHLVINAERLVPQGQLSIAQILKVRKFSLYNYLRQQRDLHQVPGVLILTATDVSRVAPPIIDAVDFVIKIEKYSIEQLELVVLQRLKYAGFEYEREEVLSEIVKQGNGQLKQVIRFLRLCVVVMGANGREIVMLKDVKKALRLRGD